MNPMCDQVYTHRIVFHGDFFGCLATCKLSLPELARLPTVSVYVVVNLQTCGQKYIKIKELDHSHVTQAF